MPMLVVRRKYIKTVTSEQVETYNLRYKINPIQNNTRVQLTSHSGFKLLEPICASQHRTAPVCVKITRGRGPRRSTTTDSSSRIPRKPEHDPYFSIGRQLFPAALAREYTLKECSAQKGSRKQNLLTNHPTSFPQKAQKETCFTFDFVTFSITGQ